MHQLTQWWNGISLRTKITGVTVLMLTAGLLVSGIGTMAMLKPYMIEQLDDQLRAVSQTKDLRVYFDHAINPVETDVSSPLTGSPRESEFFIAVYDDAGTLQNHNWKNEPSSQYPALPATWKLIQTQEINSDGTKIFPLVSQSGTEEFRAISVLVTVDQIGNLGTAVIAISTDEAEKILAAYLAIFLGFGLGVVIGGALLTRMLVTSTFAPLREVERTAAAIADGDFSKRLGGATPNTEVGRLNRSLNTMLNRIDRAFTDRSKTIEQMRRFVGDASHELRTPLVSVRGYAELYRMGALQTPEDVAQAIDRIEKEAIRMGGLVEDLLELARLDETKPLTLTPINLVPLACDAAMDAMASSPSRSVTVTLSTIRHTQSRNDVKNTREKPIVTRDTIDLTASKAPVQDRHRPASDVTTNRPPRLRMRKTQKATPPHNASTSTGNADKGQAIVLAEENKIRQVITNLMGNAMRFTPPKSPIEIGVVVDETTQHVCLEVIDHGEGIPSQIREKIFQRFWRADTSRARETGGSGLGLAIVLSIVAAHHGTVDVVDTPGGGATFRVSLPQITTEG